MPKQIKILIMAAASILGLGVLLFLSQPNGNSEVKGNGGGNNVLEVDRALHDFGTISMKNGKVKTTFKIKNSTAEPMELSKLYTTCMCTEARLFVNGKTEGPFGMPGHGGIASFQQKIDPQQEADIEVEYDPNAHGPSGVGTIERSVIVEGHGEQLATMNIKANVTP